MPLSLKRWTKSSARKRETALTNRIRKAIELTYGEDSLTYKIWGSPTQESGISDVIGCLRGRYIALEVKLPGEEPSPTQLWQIERTRRAGGIAEVVHSVEEALDVLARV